MGEDRQSVGPEPSGRARSLKNLTGGSRKGKPNKTTKLAKDAIAAAAEELGGDKRLAEWAQENTENERVFWQSIFTKLVPVQQHISGADGAPILFRTIYEGRG